jgi:hypothetical protein
MYIEGAITDRLLFGDVAVATLLSDSERATACASCELPLAISAWYWLMLIGVNLPLRTMYAATTVDSEEDPVELPVCVELSEVERDDAAKTEPAGAADSNKISANRTEKTRVFFIDASY